MFSYPDKTKKKTLARPRGVALQVLPELRTVHFLGGGEGGGASVGRSRELFLSTLGPPTLAAVMPGAATGGALTPR